MTQVNTERQEKTKTGSMDLFFNIKQEITQLKPRTRPAKCSTMFIRWSLAVSHVC